MHFWTALFNYFQRTDFLLLVHRKGMTSNEAMGWYPDWMYEMMETDENRNKEYRGAIGQQVRGKTVLELGTGRKALWACYCADQGARKIYAIEANSKSVQSSQQEIDRRGLTDRIQIIQGFSNEVSVPEKCDVLAHDIVGCIGSNEGMVPFIEDAKARLLKPGAVHIPYRCTTYFFPTARPKQTIAEWLFNSFMRGGKSIDAMESVLMYGHRPDAMLAEPQVFEDLLLDQPMALETQRECEFIIQKDGTLDGLVFYIRLHMDKDHIIDSLATRTTWHLPYIRPFAKPKAVRRGDVLRIAYAIALQTGNPTYTVKCSLKDGNGFVELCNYTWSGV